MTYISHIFYGLLVVLAASSGFAVSVDPASRALSTRHRNAVQADFLISNSKNSRDTGQVRFHDTVCLSLTLDGAQVVASALAMVD
jgi:hypothetical protein